MNTNFPIQLAKNIRVPLSKSVFILVLALFFYVFVFAGHILFQVLFGDSSFVWSPIARFDHMPSDEYYSYEIFSQVLHAGRLPLTEGIAYETLPAWENKRLAIHSLSALLTLGFDDIRLAFAAFLILVGTLFFIVPMGVAYFVTGSATSGLLPALLFLVWPNVWSGLMGKFEAFLINGDIDKWLARLSYIIEKTYSLQLNMIKPEYVAQTFRMPFPGVAYLLLLAFFGLCIANFRKFTAPRVLSLAAASIVMLYSYQPAAILTCIFLFSWCVLCLFCKNFTKAFAFALVGLVALCFMAATGYVQSITADLNTHAVGKTLLSGQTAQLQLVDYVNVILNRYTLLGAVLLFCCRQHRTLAHSFGALLITAVTVKFIPILGLLPATFNSRLEQRALDPVFLFFCGLAVCFLWQKLTHRLKEPKAGKAAVAGAGFVAAFYLFSAFTFTSMFNQSARANLFAMPKSQHEMLAWVENNTTLDTVVATEFWIDVDYVKIYTGRETSFSSIMTSGLTPEQEMLSYLATMRALGVKEAEIQTQAVGTLDASNVYYTRFKNYLRRRDGYDEAVHFFGGETEFNTSRLVNSIIRPKWFPEMFGEPVLNEDGAIDPAFGENIVKQYQEQASLFDTLPRTQPLAVVSKGKLRAEHSLPNTCQLAYQNDAYYVYRCN